MIFFLSQTIFNLSWLAAGRNIFIKSHTGHEVNFGTNSLWSFFFGSLFLDDHFPMEKMCQSQSWTYKKVWEKSFIVQERRRQLPLFDGLKTGKEDFFFLSKDDFAFCVLLVTQRGKLLPQEIYQKSPKIAHFLSKLPTGDTEGKIVASRYLTKMAQKWLISLMKQTPKSVTSYIYYLNGLAPL